MALSSPRERISGASWLSRPIIPHPGEAAEIDLRPRESGKRLC